MSVQGTVLGNGVFIGPAVVLTNDAYPRSVDANMNLKGATIGTLLESPSVWAQRLALVQSSSPERMSASGRLLELDRP